MLNKSSIESSTSTVSHCLFPLGILLSTCTKLRVEGFPVGVGEIVLLISTMVSIILFLIRKENPTSKNIRIFSIFCLCSLVVLAIGAFFGYNIVPNYVFGDSLHDLFAYIFTSIIIIVNWGRITTFNHLQSVVRFYLFFITLYFIVIILAILSPEFILYGIDFSYGSFRISGLSENPNQLACFCVIVPFLIIYQWQFENKFLNKLYLVLSLILSVTVGIATLSDGLVLSWSVTSSLSLGLWYLKLKPFAHRSNLMKYCMGTFKYVLVPIFTLLIVSIFIYNALEYADNVYDDGGQGNDRVGRWENGIKAIKLSPFFGYGAGSYSGQTKPFENEEAHNSLIDWTLSTGIMGLLFFICIMIIYFVKLFQNRILFCASLALIIYIMFGYFLRHPFFWFNVILLVELATYHKKRFLKHTESTLRIQ